MRKHHNKTLEKAKHEIAVKYGFKQWSDLKLSMDYKKAFVCLHEAAELAINNTIKNYETKINIVKKGRKEAKNKSLQNELRRCFPVDRVG